jgi:hypothetical protein
MHVAKMNLKGASVLNGLPTPKFSGPFLFPFVLLGIMVSKLISKFLVAILFVF